MKNTKFKFRFLCLRQYIYSANVAKKSGAILKLSALHLSATDLEDDRCFKFVFGLKEIVDLTRRKCLKKSYAVFFTDIQHGLLPLQFIAVMSIYVISLSLFGRIEPIDWPETLRFLWRKIQPPGDEIDLHGLDTPCRGPLWFGSGAGLGVYG